MLVFAGRQLYAPSMRITYSGARREVRPVPASPVTLVTDGQMTWFTQVDESTPISYGWEDVRCRCAFSTFGHVLASWAF